MFWFFVAVAAVLVVTFIIAASAQIDNNITAASLNDFQFPDNNNGRAVPAIFGTVWLYGNIMFYCCLHSRKIRSCRKKKWGLF